MIIGKEIVDAKSQAKKWRGKRGNPRRFKEYHHKEDGGVKNCV